MIILFFPLFLFSSSYSFSFPAFLLMIGAPALSLIFQLALMRSREYIADADAAGLTGDPDSLARALRKLSQTHFSFLSIIFPVPRRQDRSLFRTHPDMEERIRRLRNIRQ
jgi:heat shock protein HtpX